MAGCETKSFIDPSELGRYKRDPLLLPILPTLDIAIEEPVEEFVNATDIAPEDLQADGGDYVIGKNDLVSISITDLVSPGVETVVTKRVNESGNVSLPLIGQVRASGLTEAQLEQAVVKGYRDANLIQNAQVTATVAEARGRTFSVLGATAGAGQYSLIEADFRLLDVFVLTRDFPPQGVDYIYIIRSLKEQPAAAEEGAMPEAQPPGDEDDLLRPRGERPAGRQAAPATAAAGAEGERFITVEGQTVAVRGAAPATRPADDASGAATEPFEFGEIGPAAEKRVIRVPVDPLRRGDLRYNVVIRPGDLIMVPPPLTGEYYMGGHVARVGVYSLTGRRITLKQAVVSAGMLDGVAIPARTDIIRRIGRDKEVYARVDLDAIFEGRQPDLFLKPDDIVQVGTNALAPFIAAVRGGFRFSYGFGFLYDRNFGPRDNNRR